MAKGNAGSVILAFLAGGLVGAGAALLFAPSSGNKSRKRIVETTHDVKSRAVLGADHAKDKAVQLTEHAREKLDEAKHSVVAAVDAGKEAFQRTKDDLIHHHHGDEEEAEEA